MNISFRFSAIIILILLCSTNLFAQHYSLADFYKIDSLAQRARPKDALILVGKIVDQAKERGDSPLLIKSVIYRMMFQSYLEEDAFDKVLEGLRGDISTAKQPEKSILQSLLAETYWNYFQQNSWKIRQRTQVQGDVGNDIKTWSIKKLNEETIRYFMLSLAEIRLLQQTKVDILDGVLIGNKNNRSFRPTLYDLLAHRAISVFENTQMNLTQYDEELIDSRNPALLGSRDEFLKISLPRDSTLFNVQALQLFKNLVVFHQQANNRAALADVDLKRLKFVQQHFPAGDTERYYNALENLADQSRQNEVYADILYEQADLRKNASLSIDTNKQNLVEAVALAEKAVKVYPKSMGGINAANLIKEVKSGDLSLKVKNYILPNQAAELLLSYKNVDTIYLRLFKGIEKGNDYDTFDSKSEFLSFYNTNKIIREWKIVVPKSNDYQLHTLIDKIDGLPFGDYLLIARITDQVNHNVHYSDVSFSVTGMAVFKRDYADKREYFVSSLTNGAPLKDIQIQPKIYDYDKRKYIDGDLVTTNDHGIALSEDDNANYALVTRGKDVLHFAAYGYYRYHDDEEEDRVILFTDRPIYRPGQTVYYKGLCITSVNGKNKISAKRALEVHFNDANRKKITSTQVTANEYGTFQGSFTIPVGKLNGSMEIRTDDGSISVQVEEYKRPTFEVVFDKLDKTHKLNDSIAIGGKVTAFSGYTVNDGQVSYKVFRTMMYNNMLEYRQNTALYGSRFYNRTQVAVGKVKVDKNGKFSIPFMAKAMDSKQNYSFEIEANVTDLNGETRSKNTSVNVGSKDLNINIATKQVFFLGKKTDSLTFEVTNLNNRPVKARVNAEWNLLQAPERLVNKSFFNAERSAMSREEFIKTFPHTEYNNELTVAKWPTRSVELKESPILKNGRGQLIISQKNLQPGYYKICLSAINDQNDTVKTDKYVVVYPSQPVDIQSNAEWLMVEKNSIKPNEEAVFRLAGLAKNDKAYYEVYYRDSVFETVWVDLSVKQRIVKIKPHPVFEEGYAVQFNMVHQGVVYQSMQNVSIDDPSKELNIRFLTFRNKLQPGEKESWKLQIGNNTGEKQMAEMVATLYDASLDELKKMDWNTALSKTFDYGFYNWNFKSNNIANSKYIWFFKSYDHYTPLIRTYENLDLFGYNYYGNYNNGYRQYLEKIRSLPKTGLLPEAINKLAELAKGKLVHGAVFDRDGYSLPGVQIKAGKLATTTNAMGIYSIDAKKGETISYRYLGYSTTEVVLKEKKRVDVILKADSRALNEIAVRGYATVTKKSLTGSISQVVGAPVLQGKVMGLMINDAESSEAIAVEDKSPSLRQEVEATRNKKPNVVARTNFNELAFFYPQLLTDEKGEIKIEFTIPQSLTRYKMMGFAHTKDLKTASLTRELVTQKQLAIAINAPRFFREADTVVLSAKINNLAGKKLSGKASLSLTDALTGKALEIFWPNEKAEKTFEVDNAGSLVLKWNLIIPSGISALTYKVLAQSERFSDGEENTVPVLSNAMLVTESMPVNVRGNTTGIFTLEKLQQSGSSKTLRNQSLTFEFSSNPVWYVVQALPYLIEYPYDCAEQTFTRFYANSFATGIINSSPKIKTVFEQWKNTNNGEALLSNLEKNQELKSVLLEETPWVRNAENESERKKRLSILFDLNNMTYELKNNFEKLRQMQYNNGAFPWFTGMAEDRYITQHIVLGMGQLRKMKMVDEKAFPGFDAILGKAVAYLDAALIKDYRSEVKGKNHAYLPLHYLYARSYITSKNTATDFTKARDYYIKKIIAEWKSFEPYQLAQTALVLNRNGYMAEARKVITLLNQTAQHRDEMGMYWANNKPGWWWYQSPVETQALLIEAFDEVANDTKAVEEMKIWLLKNKQTNDWKTTKATAAACYALLMKGTNLLSEGAEPDITIGSHNLSDFRKAGAIKETGTGYEKVTIAATDIKPEMAKVEVKNNNQTIAWGALYWQYFEQLDKITPAKTGIKIKKQLFIQKTTDKGDVLTPITSSNVLTTGDLLKVRIEIVSDRDMEYLHLKDMRSSGVEPVNVISRYKYQDGLGYYESTKDASTNFFISYMPKGTYIFEYPLRVTHSGNFSNGITSLQSMYAPEFTTNSEGIRITVK